MSEQTENTNHFTKEVVQDHSVAIAELKKDIAFISATMSEMKETQKSDMQDIKHTIETALAGPYGVFARLRKVEGKLLYYSGAIFAIVTFLEIMHALHEK